MAKQVILAHPFERISGNVTRAKQKLVYAENDNPAWQAPEGKQYARNFKPQMNLRYSASSGKTSFTIQTKSAIDNTSEGRLRMACFGGTQAIVNTIKRNPTQLAKAYEEYAKVRDNYKSLDSFLALNFRQMLKTKSPMLTIGNFAINNPWVRGGTGYGLDLTAEILQKFAEYLCPVQISVDGKIVAGAPSTSVTFHGTLGFVSSKFNNGDFAVSGEDAQVTYKGNNLYKGADEVVGTSTVVGPFSTTAPNA